MSAPCVSIPDDHRYSCDDITWADQMAVFTERRIPLFVRASLDRVAQLLRSFPELIVVTGSQGSNPLDRYAWPLVEKFPHLILRRRATSWTTASRSFAADTRPGDWFSVRGFRTIRAASAMLTLAHAEISAADRKAIASDNLSSNSGGGLARMNSISHRCRNMWKKAIRRVARSWTCTGTWARFTAVFCLRQRR